MTTQRDISARLDRAAAGARAADRVIARMDERENSQVSCGTVEGHGMPLAANVGGLESPQYPANRGKAVEAERSEYQASPAGIDLRTEAERAVDKHWGKYLLEIAKLQRAVDGIAAKESK